DGVARPDRDDNARAAVEGDLVACAARRAADGIVRGLEDVHARTAVAADVVGLDAVAGRAPADEDPGRAVAGDDVAPRPGAGDRHRRVSDRRKERRAAGPAEVDVRN